MKRFDNIADDGQEKALRRGYTVPDGAVNIAWAKAPVMSPKNNIILVDTSKTVSANQTSSNKANTIAYADVNGILEDENGNQIWDEEYPIISDMFLTPDDDALITDYTADKILPFLHVSRHFHIDLIGIGYRGSLQPYSNQDKIKIVDKNGNDYLDLNGKKRYKVFLIGPNTYSSPAGAVESVYRVYVFFDSNPDVDELYLTYRKVQLSNANVITNQELNYKERLNPRPYYKYVPEESDVADLAQAAQTIYSTKPSNLKDQILGGSQNSVHGWKYFVPRKAVPDPRIFQIFKWRAACEFTRTVNSIADSVDPLATAVIKAGVIIPNAGNHLHSYANFFFYQLNESDYNFSGVKFVNPLQSPSLAYDRNAQQAASYWQVNLDTISLGDLAKFDVLLWAPTAALVDFSPYLPKINYFTQTAGGTMIFESGSTTNFYNLPGGVTLSTPLDSMLLTPAGDTAVSTAGLRFYDATADNPNDTFSSFGMWKKWPPNIGDILNSYDDTGSILASASVIAGWDITTAEQQLVSGYENIPNTRFQFIKAFGSGYKKVFEAPNLVAPFDYKTTVIHQKFNSGGNIFISTCSLFDDHMFEVNGNLATRSLQIANISTLDANHQINFKNMVSSPKIETEMKLRLNTMLLATVFRPSPITTEGSLTNAGNAQSTIVYSDWQTSWVIDGNVLIDKEKNDNNFALLPIDADHQEPVWQRILDQRNIKEIIDAKVNTLDPSGINPIYQTSSGATKRYFMLVTNPQVQVKATEVLNDTTIPTAWTTAYSPAFEVPHQLGTYAVRDEMIAGTGVGAGRRLYPPKPYDVQASVSYYNTAQTQGKITANVSMTGTYRQSFLAPDTTQTVGYWIPGTSGYFTDIWMHWNGSNGFNSYRPGYQHMGLVSPYSVNPPGFPASQPGGSILNIPNGIDTWADANYKTEKTNNWPFMGQAGHLTIGSRGELVRFVQMVINQLVFFGDITGPYVKEDGYYGQITANKVLEFQVSRGAQYLDGIVDSETLSLIGFYLISRTRLPGDWLGNVPTLRDYALESIQNMTMDSISDDNYQTGYARISWFRNSPSSISQGFYLKFQDTLLINQIAVLPYLRGTATNFVSCDWVDVGVDINPAGYNYQNGSPGPMYGLGQGDFTTSENIPLNWIHIYFPERAANSVMLRLRQDGPAGIGECRFLGVRDIGVLAKRFTPGTPAKYAEYTVTVPGQNYSQAGTFSYTATMEFDAGVPKIISPFSADTGAATFGSTQPNGAVAGMIYGLRWNTNSLSISPADQSTYFTSSFSDIGQVYEGNLVGNQLSLTYNGFNNTLSAETFLQGTRIGNGTANFYTKNINNVLNPFPRSYGWVSKEDGITLVCNQEGTPYGFPAALPNQVNYSMHFARYRLDAFNTDQTLFYGFYDVNRKEFITNSYGDPEITYYDYVRRGPSNIFIAVMTSYEIDSTYNVPGNADFINRPFKWAMPVYGITTGLESKIQIMPLSPDLKYDDLWALPIKTGAFSQDVLLKNRTSGSFTNYLKNYQGQTVRAHYDVPESKLTAFSAIYGRPYTDVIGEVPLILDDFTIQVRQYPILISQQPTVTPTLADPWFPVFQIQRRNSLTSPWYDVPFTAVADYNIWDGTIILNDQLTSTDPRLIRVSYTSQRKALQLKHDGTYKLNLNPYINNPDTPVNKPLYIYITPEYVIDSNYNLIPESVQTRTVRMAFSPNIFNSGQVDFNPLAILIGIVYITDAFDINDLIILDTRKRGGGVSTAYEDNYTYGKQREAESYWDMVPNHPVSYQNGSFVIIQLPASIVNDFEEVDVINTIERNITLGTRYKYEDFSGDELNWKASS